MSFYCNNVNKYPQKTVICHFTVNNVNSYQKKAVICHFTVKMALWIFYLKWFEICFYRKFKVLEMIYLQNQDQFLRN